MPSASSADRHAGGCAAGGRGPSSAWATRPTGASPFSASRARRRAAAAAAKRKTSTWPGGCETCRPRTWRRWTRGRRAQRMLKDERKRPPDSSAPSPPERARPTAGTSRQVVSLRATGSRSLPRPGSSSSSRERAGGGREHRAPVRAAAAVRGLRRRPGRPLRQARAAHGRPGGDGGAGRRAVGAGQAGAVEPWMVFALVFLRGSFLAVDNPTRQSFVIEMVGADRVVNASTSTAPSCTLRAWPARPWRAS